MKQTLIFVLIITGMLSAQNVSVKDYIVPVSKASTIRFDGSWNWSQIGDNVNSNSAKANLNLSTFYSSLPMAWFFDLYATGGKDFGNYNHNVEFNASFRKYIWDDKDWFGFSKLYVKHENTYQQILSNLSVGFGYGRYINATPLAKAVRIEDHLIDDKLIKSRLPKEIILSIANIIEKQTEYKSLYGEIYENYWLKDIVDELEKVDSTGIQAEGPLPTLRVRQVLFNTYERVNDRYYGWDVSAGFLFPLTNAFKEQNNTPNITLIAHYAVPINWSMQVNMVGELYSPMDSTFGDYAGAQLGVDFIYELSSRVNFVTSYRYGYTKSLSMSRYHNLDLAFLYYLENNLYLSVSATYTKTELQPRSLRSFVGLQYNFF